MAKDRRVSTRRTVARVAIVVLLLLAAVFYVTNRYKRAHFGDAQIDEIIFYFTNGADSGQMASLTAAAQDNILFCGIVFFLLLLPVIDFYRNRITINLDLSFLGRAKKLAINPSRIRLKYKFIYALSMFLLSTWLLLSSFGVFDYVWSLTQTSTLYEEHYVEPRTAALEFPEKKRNLVYIYLESMENTLFSKENGGQMGKSIMPELEKLALDNVSFSNRQAGLGGALPATGTTWTVGAMMAQSGGVPLKSSVLGQDHNSMGLYKQFLPGAYTLGDILHTHGYNQTFIMGSEASFGGRDKLLSQHGSYAIHDYSYAKKSGDISSDYGVWWGYEDKKLLDFAKTELGRLSQEDKPFNLQLLTVDTHFTDGWLDPSCETAYQNQYDNVHACSSKMVAEFVAWIQEQSYADDTTIIITGDHLGMQTSYYDDKITEPNYSRTVYNVFINPAVRPESSQGRLFSSFDMYPSTLAAMGVTIAGDRLALGTNLFSGQPTLVEQYGTIDALNNILSQRSEFYEKQIFLK